MLSRIVVLALLSSCSATAVLAKEQVLYNFLTASSKANIVLQGASLPSQSPERNQQNEALRRITFDVVDKPQATVQVQQTPWDISQQQALNLRIQNAMDWDLTLYVEIADTNQKTMLKALVALPAGPAQNLLIPLKATSSRTWGMRAGVTSWQQADQRYLLPIAVTGEVDTSKIGSIRFTIDKPAVPQSILLGQISAVNENAEQNAYHQVVDQYGQNARVTWSDKVTDDKQLQQMAQTEQQQLTTWLKTHKQQDKYGGIGDKPQFKATGYFRTEQHQGNWHLVSPNGYAFVTLGVNTVVPDESQTYVAGRDFMFASLPEANSPLAKFYGHSNTSSGNAAQGGRGVDKGLWYDFYQANLYRINATNILQKWRNRTIDRFKVWGFNTIGNWSDEMLIQEHRLPYTSSIFIKGDYASIPSGMDWWGYMPDTFDPNFIKAVERAVKLATKDKANDPWLIGYFADNELSWGGLSSAPQDHYALVINTLAQDNNSPAKQAFIKQLQAKYGDISQLAHAWGISVKSWDEMQQKGFKAPVPNNQYAAIQTDYSQFLKRYADNYFKIVKQQLSKYDPNHLFLGNRFAVKLPEVISSCAKYCDVISLNIYKLLPEQGYDRKLIASLNKPIMISEFTFGSKETGAFSADPVPVLSDKAKGESYQQFVTAAFNDPHMVGVHWFQYIDEPITGRLLDGENAYLGLVSITDRPYQYFIEKVRETNLAISKKTLQKL